VGERINEKEFRIELKKIGLYKSIWKEKTEIFDDVVKREIGFEKIIKFIEKNKRMLMKFKEAFDAGDKEGFEKLENLAKMAKKDELLKYYEEIKAGKTVPDPATMTDIPVAKVRAFQKDYVDTLKSVHPEVMLALKVGKIDKDLTDVLKKVATELVAKYN